MSSGTVEQGNKETGDDHRCTLYSEKYKSYRPYDPHGPEGEISIGNKGVSTFDREYLFHLDCCQVDRDHTRLVAID